jgi:hydroxyethylthiazole kinase
MLQAVALNKPWVLDPVGCGATTYRTAACVNMLKLQPAVVRGNASEMLALAGAAGGWDMQCGTVRHAERAEATEHIHNLDC